MLAGNVCSLAAAAPRRARGAHCAARRFIDTDVTHRRPTGPDRTDAAESMMTSP